MDATSPPSATALLTREDRLSAWLPGVVLAAAVCIAYLRVWHAGFIWDDDDHLTRNPCIVGPLGFGDIWTSSRAVYYPLVLTSFWVQHALWGLAPLPYHLVNVALHAACAVLLWRVLLRLRVAGAWLGAALWALHPVQVETAAWVTEQKNTQSCLFYLLAILFFLQWRETARKFATGEPPEGFPRTRRYVMALVCALLAILSKSSTVMLPVVLGLCWWWMEYREEPKRRRGRRWLSGIARWLAPFFMVAAVASAWTVWEQKYANHALGAEWSQTWPERGIIAGRDVWFYLWKTGLAASADVHLSAMDDRREPRLGVPAADGRGVRPGAALDGAGWNPAAGIFCGGLFRDLALPGPEFSSMSISSGIRLWEITSSISRASGRWRWRGRQLPGSASGWGDWAGSCIPRSPRRC